MQRHLALLALLALPTGALCQVNSTPGDTMAVLVAVDQDWFYNDGQYFTTAAQNQQYYTQGLQYIQLSPSLTPGIDLATLIDKWSASGLVHVSSDGNTGDGFMFASYPYTQEGQNAAIAAAQDYTTNKGFSTSEIKIYPYGPNRGYGLSLSKYGVQQRFKCKKSPIVMFNVCYSSKYASDVVGNGARFVLAVPGSIDSGNQNTAGTALYNAYEFWRRMDGQEGTTYRTCTKAKEGLTDNDPFTHQNLALVASGNGSIVLSPYVSYCSVPNNDLGSVGSWSTHVSLSFSTDMLDADFTTGWFIIFPGSGDARVTNVTIGSSLSFSVSGLRQGSFSLRIKPKSADGLHELDGNSNPSGSNGKGPGGDAFVITGWSTYNDPLWDARFCRAGAFPIGDSTLLYCVTSSEVGSESLAVYAGYQHDRLLATIPAAGSKDRPRYYEWTIHPESAADTIFEVTEVDNDPAFDYTTRPFPVRGVPSDIDSLRALNAQQARPIRPPTRVSALGSTLGQLSAVQPVDFLFASRRADFLAACNPVKQFYASLGLTCRDTLLATRDPNVLRSYFRDLCDAAWAQGKRTPVLYLVGSTSLTDTTYDIMPSFYFTDQTGQMSPATFPDDGFFAAFGTDSMPQALVQRIAGVTVEEVQNAVATGSLWHSANGQSGAKPFVLLLNGNVYGCGQVSPEPTQTMLRIQGMYPAGTLKATFSDSSYGCSDFISRAADMTWYINTLCGYHGANADILGTGTQTAPWIWPAYMFQQVTQDGWFTMEYLQYQYPNPFVAIMPGCSLGEMDQNPTSNYIGRLMLTSSPSRYSTAMCLSGPTRGNAQTYHLRATELYAQNRTSGRYWCVQEALRQALLQLVQEQPGAKWYARSFAHYGWVAGFQDMLPLTGVGESRTRDAINLAHPSPNPAHERVSITFSLDVERTVRLAIYDVSGRQVTVLADGLQSAGQHAVVWNGRSGTRRMPTGIYFLRLDTETTHINRKVTILR